METKQSTFFEDPGHGWLEVPLVDIFKAGVEDKISSYSYLSDGVAYLEEDCDAPLFVKSLEDAGIKVGWTREHRDEIFIRNLERFKL